LSSTTVRATARLGSSTSSGPASGGCGRSTPAPIPRETSQSPWRAAIYVSAALGFAIPFFVLLWGPSKRSRAALAIVCVSILLSRISNTRLLVLPEFERGTPFWLDIAALLALGGGMLLLFAWALPRRHRMPARFAIWGADHA